MAGIARTSRLAFGLRRGAFFIAVAGWISVGLILTPSSVEAGCSDWNATGEFTFVQTNGYNPTFKLNQTGSDIHGTAGYPHYYNPNSAPVTASVDGYIQGDNFEVTAYWNNGTAGVYSGRIGGRGRIEGSTYDKRHPDAMARWYSEPTLSCGPPVAAPASGPAAEAAKKTKRMPSAERANQIPNPNPILLTVTPTLQALSLRPRKACGLTVALPAHAGPMLSADTLIGAARLAGIGPCRARRKRLAPKGSALAAPRSRRDRKLSQSSLRARLTACFR